VTGAGVRFAATRGAPGLQVEGVDLDGARAVRVGNGADALEAQAARDTKRRSVRRVDDRDQA
jgi:hypothetical protein